MPKSTASADGAEKAKRNRKPSPFTPKRRLTLAVHSDVKSVDLERAASAIALAYGDNYAVRIAQRDRREGADPNSPVSTMVYIAPVGYTWAAEVERGVRLDADTANLLRPIAEAAGISVSELVKRMAEQAAGR